MATKADEDFADTTAGCLLSLMGLPLVCVARGVALSVLWGWFVAPLGVAAVGVTHATGLFLVVNVVAPGTSRPAETLAEKVGRLGAALLHPAILVGLGYLVRLTQTS